MSIVAGELLLELAASHLLPVLVTEVGEYTIRRAARSALRGEAARPTGVEQRPARPSVVAEEGVALLSEIPGRVRFQVARARGDARRVEALAARLRVLPGVTDARASTLTGSVLVHFDPQSITVAHLRRALHEPVEPPSSPRPRRAAGDARQLALVNC